MRLNRTLLGAFLGTLLLICCAQISRADDATEETVDPNIDEQSSNSGYPSEDSCADGDDSCNFSLDKTQPPPIIDLPPPTDTQATNPLYEPYDPCDYCGQVSVADFNACREGWRGSCDMEKQYWDEYCTTAPDPAQCNSDAQQVESDCNDAAEANCRANQKSIADCRKQCKGQNSSGYISDEVSDDDAS